MIRREMALKRLHSANPLPGDDHVDGEELSAFIALFEERRSQMTTTPTTKPTRSSISPKQPGSRLRPVLVFGTALILVLGLIGGVVLLSGGDGDDTVATTTTSAPPSTTAPPQTSAAPATTTTAVEEPAVPVAELEWTRLTVGTDEPDSSTRIYGDAGWVGFRQLEPTPTFAGATVPMRSADGLNWEEVQDEAGLFEGYCVQEPVFGAGRYLVLTYACLYEGGPDRLLTSIDGETWSQVPLDAETVFSLGAFAHGASGFVSLSGSSFFDGFRESGGQVAAFHSPDGLTWERIPADEAIFGLTGWIGPRDVVYGDAGYVAIGVDDSPDGQNGVIWHSPDGIAWTRVPNEGDLFGGPNGPGTWIEMEAVAYGNGTYVAIGVGPPTPTIWTSSNGLTWSVVPNEGGVFGSDDEAFGFSDVAFGDPGFLVVGSVLEERPWGDGSGNTAYYEDTAAAWTSVNGLDWTRVPYDEEVFGSPGDISMHSVIYGDGMFVVGGFESLADEDSPIVWIAR